eukprot:834296-Prymnesium_polylepis.1
MDTKTVPPSYWWAPPTGQVANEEGGVGCELAREELLRDTGQLPQQPPPLARPAMAESGSESDDDLAQGIAMDEVDYEDDVGMIEDTEVDEEGAKRQKVEGRATTAQVRARQERAARAQRSAQRSRS